MKYAASVLVVRDMRRSRAFYEKLFGLMLQFDHGENILYKEGLSLQTLPSWKVFLGSESPVGFKSHSFELYFEEEHFDAFIRRLSEWDIQYVHEPKEFSWGQRAVRFYDPDGHVIEVGESMCATVRRLFAAGCSSEQELAEKTQHPLWFIRQCLESLK